MIYFLVTIFLMVKTIYAKIIFFMNLLRYYLSLVKHQKTDKI